MLHRVSSYELTEWMAFLQIEHEEREAAERAEQRKGATT